MVVEDDRIVYDTWEAGRCSNPTIVCRMEESCSWTEKPAIWKFPASKGQPKHIVQRRLNVGGSWDKPTVALTIAGCAKVVCNGCSATENICKWRSGSGCQKPAADSQQAKVREKKHVQCRLNHT